ncbi:MAG: glycosyltransferase family 39 protein [Acidobacteriota bacterium]
MLLPLGVFVFYLCFTSFDLGWSDNYGYVSLALRMADLHFAEPETTLESLGLHGDGAITTPLAYNWVDGRSVPLYPLGAPALMVPLVWMLGSKGPFVLPPLMGALCLVVLYRLGKEISGRAAGYAAAVLAFLSPPLVSFSTIAMSDVVASFFICLATLFLLLSRRRIAFAAYAGLCLGAALLTRPNMALFAVPAGLFFLAERRLKAAVWFAAGVLPAIVLQLTVNRAYYGGWLSTGYGAHTGVFTAAHFWTILSAYLGWLVQFGVVFQLPFILWALWDRRVSRGLKWLAVSWFVVLLSFFCFYPFWYHWLLSRYVLPALLLAHLLAGYGTVEAARACSSRWLARTAAPTLAGLCALYAGLFLYGENMHRVHLAWAKVADMAQGVHDVVDDRSLVFAYSHSGTLRYYQGIKTANLNNDAPECEKVITDCHVHGIAVYALLDTEPDEWALFDRLPSRRFAVEIARPQEKHLFRVFSDEAEVESYLRTGAKMHIEMRSVRPLPSWVGRGWDRKQDPDGRYMHSKGPNSSLLLLIRQPYRFRLKVRLRPLSLPQGSTAFVDLFFNGAKIGSGAVTAGWSVIEGQTPAAVVGSNTLELNYRLAGDPRRSFFAVLADCIDLEPIDE